jgi:hypothetical protein
VKCEPFHTRIAIPDVNYLKTRGAAVIEETVMALPIQIIDTFAGQNWLITPAARAINEPPPADIHGQKWLMTLSGVGMVNLEGNSQAQWLQETLLLLPTIIDPMHYAIATHGIPTPQGSEGSQYALAFQVEQWSPYASISSIFNQGQSLNSGFAVDVWRPNHFGTGVDAFSHQAVGNLYSGLQVDVAVRDTDAWLYRVGYNILLLGRIVFLTIPETLFRSDFNKSVAGQPPSQVQAVGTADVTSGVIVINPPAPPPILKWVQISPATVQVIPGFHGVFSQFRGDGLYTFTATIFMAANTGVSSISFEQAAGGEFGGFLHLDLMPDNKVRIDDDPTTEFGAFPRGQSFTVQVTLNINASASTAHIVLANGASGQRDYTVRPIAQGESRQLDAIRLWQGFEAGMPSVGTFDATNIVVTRAN